jgi:hypothetical protein
MMNILGPLSRPIVQHSVGTPSTSSHLPSTITIQIESNIRMRPHMCTGAFIGPSRPYILPAQCYRQSMPLLSWPLLQLLPQSADSYRSLKNILCPHLYVVCYGLAVASHIYSDRFNVPRMVTVLPDQSRLQSSSLQPPLRFTFLADFLFLQSCRRVIRLPLLSILHRPSLAMLPSHQLRNQQTVGYCKNAIWANPCL